MWEQDWESMLGREETSMGDLTTYREIQRAASRVIYFTIMMAFGLAVMTWEILQQVA